MQRRIATVMTLSAAAVAVVLPSAASADLRADYRFEGNLKSAVGNVPKLAKVGSGGDFKRQRVGNKRQGVWKWPEGDGLRLNKANKAVGNGGLYTVVMLVNLDDIEDYNKLIDWSNLADEEGLYVEDGMLDPYELDESDPVVDARSWVQIAMARSRSENVHLYLNGRRVLTTQDPDDTQVLGADRILHFLLDDESTEDEETGGRIARLRLWDHTLSTRKIKNLGR
jgi:Concanavalin A-like lectin/glucanases superfamily